MIKIIDNFLKIEDCEKIINLCKISNYCYGERERLVGSSYTPPTGMTCELNSNSYITSLFEKNLTNSYLEIKKFYLHRIYINCFAPSETPYFHIDGKFGITCLYYPTEIWDCQDGGETQFMIDGEIKGILPLPNRMVIFDANILHRATCFRNSHRFTIALKYKKINFTY